MESIAKRLYEAMFLIDSTEAAADWDRVEANIKRMLEKVDAEIVSIKKWDERRLAYEIDGISRGTYVLCYFMADGSRNQDIERDVRLSGQFMRVLILRSEHLSQEDIEKDTPVTLADKMEDKAAETVRDESEAAPARTKEDSVAVLQEDADDQCNEADSDTSGGQSGDEGESEESGQSAENVNEPGQADQFEAHPGDAVEQEREEMGPGKATE